MGNINYSALITDLNDVAFKRCVSLLYPELAYKYLAEEEVRRIDLCEKLASFSNKRRMSPAGNGVASYEEYLTALEYYLDHYLPCEKGSQADQYKKQAKALLLKLRDKGTVASMETLFAIVLGLARTLNPDFLSNKIITGITLYASEADEALLCDLRNFGFTYQANRPFGKTVKNSKEEKQMLYVHNVIMYCRLMQAQGVFEEGEK